MASVNLEVLDYGMLIGEEEAKERGEQFNTTDFDDQIYWATLEDVYQGH